jgi:uncharacterized DUF497 family protein
LEFEWDKDKRLEVIERRGVDFRQAALIFDGPVLTVEDTRRDYGERRYISIGMAGPTCLVVVHTPRGEKIRIISAWLGGRSEERAYRESLAR